MEKRIVISLGGSLIFPQEDKIDVVFLKRFKKTILQFVKKGWQFAIITGGGKIARKYQKSLSFFQKDKNELDQMGIFLTWANAFLLKSIFQKKADILNWSEKIYFKNKIIVLGGKEPGFSTDFCSVLVAQKLNIKTILNLSNIDFVYTKDPRRFKDAKPIRETNWKNFQKIIGQKWKPGISLPFDPRASEQAKKDKITVYFLNGRKIENLKNFFKGKRFTGTKIC